MRVVVAVTDGDGGLGGGGATGITIETTNQNQTRRMINRVQKAKPIKGVRFLMLIRVFIGNKVFVRTQFL